MNLTKIAKMKKENKIKNSGYLSIDTKYSYSEINQTKTQLISEIEKVIREKNLTQAKMAEILGVNQQSLDMIAAAIELTHCYSLVQL